MAQKPNLDDVFSIVAGAIEIDDESSRHDYIDQACAEDPEIRHEVDRLVKAHHNAGSCFLETNPTVDETTSDLDPGSIIGPYKLIERIGEGGMGVVYMAEQVEPIRRKVAVKILKLGLDTEEVVARFEAERQALAMMNHPHIAKVLDAGATKSGRPYFVMELIRGIPITEFCLKQRLDLREQLELFANVCRAVQHAHQKGIIHRDIKPSNVLVELHDVIGVPKVIDFGVAKAISQRLTDQTYHTNFTQMIGTPLYMSPEQAQLSGLDIDTRSDIYSLGVLLYELLTGTTPFEKETFKQATYDELRRIIREDEPLRPSARVSTANAKLISTLSGRPNLDPTQLGKRLGSRLKGELDWIVMKALDKDRTRRYETANGMAADVQRYLDDQPVVACPPSATYRFRKFAQRNRVGIAFGSAIGLFLIAAVIGLIASNILITRQKDIADIMTEEALQESKYATAIADFVKDDFFALTSVEGQARFDDYSRYELSKNTTLGDLLNRAAEKLDARTDLDPRIEAQLRWMIGENYLGLCEFSRAIEFLEKSVELHRTAYGDDAEETLVAQNSLAETYSRAGQRDKARALFEQTFEIRKVMLGDDDLDTLESMNDFLIFNRDQPNEALPIFEMIFEKRKAKLGEDHPDTLESMNNVAVAYQRAGQDDKALSLLKRAVEMQKAILGEDNQLTLTTMCNLAFAYVRDGQRDKGLLLLQAAVETRKAILGEDHPDTLASMNSLAELYMDIGDFEKAMLLREQTLEKSKAILGEDHPDTFWRMHNLAYSYRKAGELVKALSLGEQAFEMCKAKLGNDHRATLILMNDLAWAYLEAGLLKKAVSLFEQILELRNGKTGEDHLDWMDSESYLAKAYSSVGQNRKALSLLEQTFEIRKAELGEDHPDTVSSMHQLGEVYRKLGQFDKALSLLEPTIEMRKAILGEDHPDTVSSMHQLGVVYRQLGQFDKALPMLEEAFESRKAILGEDQPETLDSLRALGTAYRNIDQHDKAILLFEPAIEMYTAKLKKGDGDPKMLNIMRDLGLAYMDVGQVDKSILLLERTVEMSKAILGEDDPGTLERRTDLGSAYRAAGQLDDAIRILEQTFEKAKVSFGENDKRTTASMLHLSLAYRDAGQLDKALPLLERTVELSTANAHPTKVRMKRLGELYLQVNSFDDAERVLRSLLAVQQKTRPDDWKTFVTESLLGEALLCQNKHAEAEPLLLDGCQGLIEREDAINLPINRQRVSESIQRLIQLYESWHAIESDRGFDSEAAYWQEKLNEYEARLERQ